MDEYLLNDLLECSVCLERLDTSSKVLPCQHTFCKKCLEEILSTKHELRCPECRILVTTVIDDLPPNVLLMRILEGMRHAGHEPKIKPSAEQKLSSPPLFAYNPKPAIPSAQSTTDPLFRQQPSPKHVGSSNADPIRVFPQNFKARALYDYQSVERGDLCFIKGDIITITSKIDMHWAHGECAGRNGIFPLTFVQLLPPTTPAVATCRALYDFKMNNDEVEGCLSFRKDEVLSVLRRVDENWIEGRLRNRVGIFPLAFVELNSVAKALMKLSSNEQPGPSRLAPPTPTSDESTPLIPTGAQNLILTPAADAARAPSSDSSSSTTTPNSSGSGSSSTSSSTGPSSPASPQLPQQQPNPFVRPQTILLPTSHITTQARDKRHSFTGITTKSQPPANTTNRHSAEILSSDTAQNGSDSNSCGAAAKAVDAPSSADTDQLVRQGSQRQRRSGSDLPAVTLPATYVALYPYKPLKADELELKKGGVYLVTERCQDGWFKGTSNRTQKTGVFPGNYVTLAKPAMHRAATNEAPATPPKDPRHAILGTGPPQLPPRLFGPGQKQQPREVRRILLVDTSPQATKPETNTGAAEPVSRSHISAPPNVSLAPSPVASKTTEKNKEKKERSGLMKRLAAIKRSKSPTVPAYSMDNPVFEDSSVPSAIQAVSSAATAHAAHSRSGSCPSQLMQLPVGTASSSSAHHRPMSASLSARATRQKERPSVTAAQFSHALGRVSDAGPPGSQPLATSHRKCSSLDAGDPRNQKHIVPSVRERFRCIVPYPPNSEYELELRVGDIIYVHRKREDGWYKGTQQRTGRTGLFPASFVESC